MSISKSYMIILTKASVLKIFKIGIPLLHLKLRKLLDESEATSPTEKTTEGNVQSRVPPVATPIIPSSAQPQVIIPEGKYDAAEHEDNPITSEEEITSDSSSGDATD